MPIPESAPAGRLLELIHPVYLDVPMMVSFLAALQGGVAYGGEVTERVSAAQGREREGSGKAGLPSLASLFGLSLDMTGRVKSHSQGEESTETRVVREHTEASLFNLLREALITRDEFMEVVDPTQLELVNAGQLVEVSGEILGNPLQQVLDVVGRILPYMDAGLEDQNTATRRAGSGPNRAERRRAQQRQPGGAQSQQLTDTSSRGMSSEDLTIFQVMREDVESAQVRDLVLKSSGDLRVVLTMSREFLSREAEEYLLGGRFKAIGKITRVLEGDESINLTRRTAIGLAGPGMARELINSLHSDEAGGFSFTAEDPIVEAPALQLLPLAVFI
jgi:hypothetical protein